MDWLGAAINVIGWYIMPKNRLAATCIFLISNMVWISWGVGHTTWSIVILQGCFVFLNIRAVLIWEESAYPFSWNLNNLLTKTYHLLSITDVPPPNSRRESVVALLIIIIELFRRLIFLPGEIETIFEKIKGLMKEFWQSESQPKSVSPVEQVFQPIMSGPN